MKVNTYRIYRTNISTNLLKIKILSQGEKQCIVARLMRYKHDLIELPENR